MSPLPSKGDITNGDQVLLRCSDLSQTKSPDDEGDSAYFPAKPAAPSIILEMAVQDGK